MRWLVLALLAGCGHRAPAPAPSPPPTPAPGATSPAAIGETFGLDSEVLGERRVINVYLPPGYATATASYPVLFMPDGGLGEDFPHIAGLVDVSIKNGVIRPILVVGVENTERRRDLVGPTEIASEREIAPHAGGADRFRQFLRSELKPHIAAHYRTTSEDAIIGESLAGLFVLETLLVEPELFDIYVAVSPSVWWNAQALVGSAEARFAAATPAPRQLFLATADEELNQAPIAILLDVLRAQPPPGLSFTYLPLPDEHHNTIFPLAALRGIRTVFAAPAAAP